jgi:hypothetical protein
MISGNSVRLLVGKESAYATAPSSYFKQIKIASEGFQFVPSKNQEGVLTGNIGPSKFQTMGRRTENSLSFLARPDDLGIFLKACLGEETITTNTDGDTVHAFTPIGNALTDSLPSLAFLIDKKTDVFSYVGNKINSLSFSTAAEDYLNVDLDMYGYDELVGSVWPVSPVSPSPLKAFTFSGGTVYLNNAELADVVSINFSYSNGLENTIQTTSTGLHYLEPQANLREVSFDIEAIYSAVAEQFRRDFFLTDDVFSIKLDFESNEQTSNGKPFKMVIEVPAAQVSECSNSVSDSSGIRQSATLSVIDDSNVNDMITVSLINNYTTAY